MTLAQNNFEIESFLKNLEKEFQDPNMDGYFLDLSRRIEKVRTGDSPSGMLQELKSRGFWRAVFAEFIATMVFLFIATMAAVPLVPVEGSEASVVKNALASGLMIAICIQMFGHVSGAFMNPAVTISFAVGRTISPLRAFLYVIAQCSGGSLGVLILKGVTPDELHGNLGVNMVNPRIDAVQGFACEVVFTFIVVISVYGCIDPNRPFFGSEAVGIGFTIAGVNLAGIPFTGASMNPARSFSAAFVSNSFTNHWVYWAGPILGGSIGALAYKFVFDPYKNVLSYSDAAKKLHFKHLMMENLWTVSQKDLKQSSWITSPRDEPSEARARRVNGNDPVEISMNYLEATAGKNGCEKTDMINKSQNGSIDVISL